MKGLTALLTPILMYVQWGRERPGGQRLQGKGLWAMGSRTLEAGRGVMTCSCFLLTAQAFSGGWQPDPLCTQGC